MVLMLAGAAFMAVLFAFFTGWVVARRLNILSGRVRVRGQGHFVIAGGGDIGFRVAALLREKKHRVVVIEKNAESRHLGALRGAGHHVIVADATTDGILDLAGLGGARSVLVLTNSDPNNLHIALLARACNPDIPVVMRVESPELSAHVSEKRDAVAISPVAVAVDEFVRAALADCVGEVLKR
jgi:voltage-gated potassium channel Kch